MAVKGWVKTLLTFLAGVAATLLVILQNRSIRDRVVGGLVKPQPTDAQSIHDAYAEQLQKITKETQNATRQQIIDGFMSRFSNPLPPSSGGKQ